MVKKTGQQKEKKPWRWEEDGLTVTRSNGWSGPGCHNGCGVLLYTDKKGKLVKVEGDKEHPFNQGRLCVRCLALPEVVYHPDRLKYPMKKKTDGSWDGRNAICRRNSNWNCSNYWRNDCLVVQGRRNSNRNIH